MSNAPKRGLGRGLGALLGEGPIPTAPAHAGGEVIRQIPVDRVRPNPNQPRKVFDAAALDELKTSIAEHGVLVPILVRERGDGYELIAGERRWRACAALQLGSLPAIVRHASDTHSLELAIIENLQREDLNALEEAHGISELIETHGYTQEQVAQRLGKARSSVANALRLLLLPDAITSMIAQGLLSAGHAKALLAAPEAARLELAKRVARDGVSVRALERIVTALTSAPAGKAPAAVSGLSPEEREFESRLRTRVGAHVALRRNGTGGRIEIGFASEAELIRIAEILLGE